VRAATRRLEPSKSVLVAGERDAPDRLSQQVDEREPRHARVLDVVDQEMLIALAEARSHVRLAQQANALQQQPAFIQRLVLREHALVLAVERGEGSRAARGSVLPRSSRISPRREAFGVDESQLEAVDLRDRAARLGRRGRRVRGRLAPYPRAGPARARRAQRLPRARAQHREAVGAVGDREERIEPHVSGVGSQQRHAETSGAQHRGLAQPGRAADATVNARRQRPCRAR
jgi:hypothetical protein